MKGKSTKSALLMSFTSLLLCAAMLIGTTFAWFTDSVTSGVNKIIAGNLDVDVEYAVPDENGTLGAFQKMDNTTTSLFSSNLWEPGHTEYVTLKVVNKGTLALNYKLNVSPVSESGGINMAGQSFKLSDYLVFGTTTATAGEAAPTYASRADARTAAGTTQKLTQTNLSQGGTLYPSTQITDTQHNAEYITLVVYMPETVSNEANYKTGTEAPYIDLGITVVATQKDHEVDSFDKNYDAGADLTPDNAGKDAVVYNYVPQISQSAQIKKTDSTVEFTDTNVALDDSNNLIVKSSVKVSEVTGASGDESKEFANVTVPAAVITALAEGDHVIALNVNKDDTENANFKSTSGVNLTEKETVTYEVNVTKDGTKVTSENNTAMYIVKMFVGANRANLVMYHKDQAMIDVTTSNFTAPNQFKYDKVSGFVTMQVTGFSPFTAVYDEPVAAIGTTVYYTLQEAIDAAADDDVIVLLKDQSTERFNLETKDIHLNLNGCILTGTSAYGVVFCTKNGHTITVDGTTAGSEIKGTIMCGSSGPYGHAVINGGTYTGNGYCPFYINGSVSDTCNLTIKNATIASSPVASSEVEYNFGLYLAGKSNVVLTNCTITGAYTGLEVRAGDVTLNDCVVSGNANPASFANNNNGATITGAALGVSQHLTSLPTKVTVNGGTYTGVYAVYEKADSASTKTGISLDIKAGTFNGKVSSENCTGFITGGTFSSDPKEYLSNGICYGFANGIYTVGHHDLEKHDAKLATCTEDGQLQYFTCKQCNKMFWYDNGKCEFTEVNLTVSPKSHKYMVDSIAYLESSKVNVEEKDVYSKATVTYKCPDCGDTFTKDERLVTLEVAQAGSGSATQGVQTKFYVIVDGAYVMNGANKAVYDIGTLFADSYANGKTLLQAEDVIKFPAVNVYHDRKNYDCPTMFGDVTIWGTDTGTAKTTFMLDDNKQPTNNRAIRINHRSNDTDINSFNFVDVNFQPTTECDCALKLFSITTVNIFVGCKNVDITGFGGPIFGCWAAETLADGSYANHAAKAGITVRMVGGKINDCQSAITYDTKPYNADYTSGSDTYAFADVKFTGTGISNTTTWANNASSNPNQGNWYLNGQIVTIAD